MARQLLEADVASPSKDLHMRNFEETGRRAI